MSPRSSTNIWLVLALVSGAVGVLSLVVTPGPATPLPQDTEPPPFAQFGISVAAAPDTIFVAANLGDGDSRGPGTVHVFERQGRDWFETQVLSAPEVTIDGLFPPSMAADGDTLVVGAQYADKRGRDSGLAYVFERTDDRWRSVGELRSSDLGPGDQFGLLVSISGDTIVVGSRLENTGGRDAGAAYVFERSDRGWTESAKLMASDPKPGDLFGRAAVSVDLMVVSADLNDDLGNQAGKAYAFERRDGTWGEVARLFANDGREGHEFGITLAIANETAVFGAVGSDLNGPVSGAAYVFDHIDGSWTQTSQLTPGDGGPRHGFGYALATSEDTIVVGARGHGGNGEFSGAAYIFERDGGGWTETAKLMASDAAPRTLFGNTVAASGDTVVVGVLYGGEAGDRGAAYVFERRNGTWVETARLQPALPGTPTPERLRLGGGFPLIDDPNPY